MASQQSRHSRNMRQPKARSSTERRLFPSSFRISSGLTRAAAIGFACRLRLILTAQSIARQRYRPEEIGRASCRERVEKSEVDVLVKKTYNYSATRVDSSTQL